MAEAVLSTTLETIRDLLVGQAKFLSGVSDQVEDIQRELVRMKCFLKDADEKQHKDERVHNWIREVKDLCYEIEDVLETFAVEVASKRSGHGIRKGVKRIVCLPSEAIALHKVGVHIAKIEGKIEKLRTSLATYGIRDLHAGQSSKEADEKQRWLRQTYSHADEEDFVGMQKEVSQLVQLIVDNSNKHKVIKIWGMGGLGKTTLARKVYKHEQVRLQFDAFAWVCVTQQIQFKVVLQDILSQLLGGDEAEKEEKKDKAENKAKAKAKDEYEYAYGYEDEEDEEEDDMDVGQLVIKLYEVQRKKKCMVVLDDIWEIDHFNMLRGAFPITDQAASSKLLLTTRKENVIEIGLTHQLRYLTEDEGWQLLRKKAFATQLEEKDQKVYPKFEDIGREIVHKCGGLPLAISVFGGILRSRSSLSEWQMVVDSHLSEETSGSIENVLALSYNDLPYNLKACFLYMGIFQEDEK